jgi:hypothetical protein
MQQPLGYSTVLEQDCSRLCSYCRNDDYQTECYCDGERIYQKAILCKVFTLTTPAHGLDITTPLKYEIYDLSGKPEHEVDEKFDELTHDHAHDFPHSFTIVLEGSDIEDDYRDILGKVNTNFNDLHWDFKGKYPKSRYISFAGQRIEQVFQKKNDLVPENDHLTQRKKAGKK